MATKPTSHITPYFTQDQADQVRAALQAVGHAERYASLSDLVVAATMREIKRLQRKHNDGKPWDPVPAGTARPGRRTRAETAASEDRK
ncbi:hypothetical protein [Pseudarthrobacter sp. PS3-L1]|uniref:ParB family protein n=1 Tax=Pseudarthrobacter sp. PS3-L1 TaxID=3046207 RepID=UPI0024B8DF9A|nr:hypothetical protein [Pseudarthrobacter sp. PS3-L1]MDJ0321979.1 hypothetical protein [Pseudarthrobacter sp. PS3-L1]